MTAVHFIQWDQEGKTKIWDFLVGKSGSDHKNTMQLRDQTFRTTVIMFNVSYMCWEAN